MANKEHVVQLLKDIEGSESWDLWRATHNEIIPDLSGLNLLQCPLIVYTDLNGLRLLSEWHEVKLQYSAVSMLCVPLSTVGAAASKLGSACDGVGFDPFRSSCQKAAPGTNPSNYR
jgi:hypothetical protein